MSETFKEPARAWFRELRDRLCTAFEKLEEEAPAPLYEGAPGKFVRTPWERTDHSGASGGDELVTASISASVWRLRLRAKRPRWIT